MYGLVCMCVLWHINASNLITKYNSNNNDNDNRDNLSYQILVRKNNNNMRVIALKVSQQQKRQCWVGRELALSWAQASGKLTVKSANAS